MAINACREELEPASFVVKVDQPLKHFEVHDLEMLTIADES